MPSNVTVTGAGPEYDNLQPIQPSVDEMRYALNAPKPIPVEHPKPAESLSGLDTNVQPNEESLGMTVGRMINQPVNLPSADQITNVLKGFGSAGESLGRGVVAGVPGMFGDINEIGREYLTPHLPESVQSTLQSMPAAPTTEDYLNKIPRYSQPFGDSTANNFTEGLGSAFSPSATSIVGPAGKFIGEAAAERIMGGLPLIPGVPSELTNPVIMSAIKHKGGNWLHEQHGIRQFEHLVPIEGHPSAFENPFPNKEAYFESMAKNGYSSQDIQEAKAKVAINEWLHGKLNKYLDTEFGTPEDPVRILADERGIHHVPLMEDHANTIRGMTHQLRKEQGFPEKGYAKTPLGRQWENASDASIMPRKASIYQENGRLADRAHSARGWINKLDPNTPVFTRSIGSSDDGFEHLLDELKNAATPGSGIPGHLRIKPEVIPTLSVPNAIERVHRINEWRAEQMAKAAKQGLKDFPIVHEGPNGFNIHHIKLPEVATELPKGFSIKPVKDHFAVYDENGKDLGAVGKTPEAAAANYLESEPLQKLDRALKNEGKQMGHCVGCYTDSVARGDTMIFSLRGPNGKAHATIEAKPAPIDTINITQIKGPGNKVVTPEYRHIIQDYLNKRADKLNKVEELYNVGLTDVRDPKSLAAELKDMYGEDGIHLFNEAVDSHPNSDSVPRFLSREELRKLIEGNKKQNSREYNFESIKTETLNKPQIVHHTSDIEPRISALESRWMPNSISANEQSPNYVWGSKAHKIEIPAGAKVGKLNSIFDILPEGVQATPKQIGKALHDYAKQNNLDAIRVKNVHGSGGDPEWSIFNESYLNKRADKLKAGGHVHMNTGGVPPTPNIPQTPAKTNPNTTDYVPKRPVDPGFAEVLERVRSAPKGSSVSGGGSGGGGGLSDAELKNKLGNRNITYNVGGKVTPDQMRYELLRKK
jgi:hypothetical protein